MEIHNSNRKKMPDIFGHFKTHRCVVSLRHADNMARYFDDTIIGQRASKDNLVARLTTDLF